jgi:hypothetical protein
MNNNEENTNNVNEKTGKDKPENLFNVKPEKLEKEFIITNVLSEIKSKKNKKDLGEFNSIPFNNPFLDKHTPGIFRGMIYAITAGTGIGKFCPL